VNPIVWDATIETERYVMGPGNPEYALLLAGSTVNPDKLRMDAAAVKFMPAFAASGKPVAAICHGPWTPVEADVVRGRR